MSRYGYQDGYRRREPEMPYDRPFRGGNPGAQPDIPMHAALQAAMPHMSTSDRLRALADQMDASAAADRMPAQLPPPGILPAAPYGPPPTQFAPAYVREGREQLRDRDVARYRPPDLHPSYRDREGRPQRETSRPKSGDAERRQPERQQLPQAVYVQRQQLRWLLKTRIQQVRAAIGQMQAALCPRDKKVAAKMPKPMAGVYAPSISPDFHAIFGGKLDYEALKCAKLSDLLRSECPDFIQGTSSVNVQYWVELSSEVATPSHGETAAARRNHAGIDPDTSAMRTHIITKCLLAVGYSADDIARVLTDPPAAAPAPEPKAAKLAHRGQRGGVANKASKERSNGGQEAAAAAAAEPEVTIVSTSTSEGSSRPAHRGKRGGNKGPTKRDAAAAAANGDAAEHKSGKASAKDTASDAKAPLAQGPGMATKAAKNAAAAKAGASALASAAATLVTGSTAAAAAVRDDSATMHAPAAASPGKKSPVATDGVAVTLKVQDDGSVAVGLGTAESEVHDVTTDSPAAAEAAGANDAISIPDDAEAAAMDASDVATGAEASEAGAKAEADPADATKGLSASDARAARAAALPDSEPLHPWGAKPAAGDLDPCALDAAAAALLPVLRDRLYAAVAACCTPAQFYRDVPSKEKPVPPDLKLPPPELVLIKPFGLTDAETAHLGPEARKLAVNRTGGQLALPRQWPAADVWDAFNSALADAPAAAAPLSALSTEQEHRLMALAALPHMMRTLSDGRVVALSMGADALPDTQLAVHRLRQCAHVCMLDAMPWQNAALKATGRRNAAIAAPVVTVDGELALPISVIEKRMDKILGAKHSKELLAAARAPSLAAFLTSSHAADLLRPVAGDAAVPLLEPSRTFRSIIESHVVACAEALSLCKGPQPNYRALTILREHKSRHGVLFRPEFLGFSGVSECLSDLAGLIKTRPAPAKREWPLVLPSPSTLLRHLLLQTLRAAAAADGSSAATPASVTVGLDVLRTAYGEAYHSPHPAADNAGMRKAVEALGWQFKVEGLRQDGSEALRITERVGAVPPLATATSAQGRVLWDFLHQAYDTGSRLTITPYQLPAASKLAAKRPAETAATGTAKQARTTAAAAATTAPKRAAQPTPNSAAARIAMRRDRVEGLSQRQTANGSRRDQPPRHRDDPPPQQQQQPQQAFRTDRRVSLPARDAPHDRRGGGRPLSPPGRYPLQDVRGDRAPGRFGHVSPADRHRHAPYDRRVDEPMPGRGYGGDAFPPGFRGGYEGDGMPPDAMYPPPHVQPGLGASDAFLAMQAQGMMRNEDPRFAPIAPGRAFAGDGPAPGPYGGRGPEPVPEVLYAPEPQSLMRYDFEPSGGHGRPDSAPQQRYGASPGLRYQQVADAGARYGHDGYGQGDGGGGGGGARYSPSEPHPGARHDAYAAPPVAGLGQGYTVAPALEPGRGGRGGGGYESALPSGQQQQPYAPPQGAVRYVIGPDGGGGGQQGFDQQGPYAQQSAVRTFYVP